MWVWYFGNKRRDHYERESEYVSLLDYRDQLTRLTDDESVPFYTTNLVYMTKIKSDYRIKRSTMYSILDQEPKRAKVYWFVTVNETNAPYESNYTVDMLGTKEHRQRSAALRVSKAADRQCLPAPNCGLSGGRGYSGAAGAKVFDPEKSQGGRL